MSNDPTDYAKNTIGVVAEVMKAAGDNPNVKEAANNLGQTAVTLTKTINNVLLPLAAVNFAFDKAKAYFAGKFQEDLSEKTAQIPQDQIIEPKASVAGPTLQGLAFTHEEADLKEMYLNLLATSMDQRHASSAHPAFVEIIKQLDGEDAQLTRVILTGPQSSPIAQIRRKKKGETGFTVLRQHLMNLTYVKTNDPYDNPNLPAQIDNLIRLGLVTVEYDSYLTDENKYSWINKRPEFIHCTESSTEEDTEVIFQKGILQRTDLGKKFALAVGLSKTQPTL